MTATTTTWNELIVTDAEGDQTTLRDIVSNCPANLDNAVIRDGRIQEWEGFFLSAPGEEPNWNTPLADVDWSGFSEAWQIACGQAN